MQKLRINFDIIDKIYESQGKHNVRRWLRLNKVYDIAAISLPAMHIVGYLVGYEPLDSMIESTLRCLAIDTAIWAPCEILKSNLMRKVTGLNYKERAGAELLALCIVLNGEGIQVAYDNLNETEVYHKKYKLAMEGTPGIIRERYFNIPTFDSNGDETVTSLKEEHLIGSSKYDLSIDKPEKKKVFKLAYNN